jgi:hypothetical protein
MIANAERVAEFRAKSGFSLRIAACARILCDEKREKMEEIAENRGVSIETAGAIYVWGALKSTVRRGTSRTISDALDRFESEQIGDRAVSVHGEASINREVRRINKINDTRGGKGIAHKRNMGKVLGTLYIECDLALEATRPEVVLESEAYDGRVVAMENEISAYIRDYVSRLSRTAKASIRQIVASKLDSAAIMGAKVGSHEYALRNKAGYLFGNFPIRENITQADFIDILRKYA